MFNDPLCVDNAACKKGLYVWMLLLLLVDMRRDVLALLIQPFEYAGLQQH